MAANTPKIQPVHSWTVFSPPDPATPITQTPCQDAVVTNFTNNFLFQSSEASLVRLFAFPDSTCNVNAGADPILFSRATTADFSPLATVNQSAPEGADVMFSPTSMELGMCMLVTNDNVRAAFKTLLQSLRDSDPAKRVQPAYDFGTAFLDMSITSDEYYPMYGQRVSTIIANSSAVHFTSVEGAQRALFLAAIDNEQSSQSSPLEFWRAVNRYDALYNNEVTSPNWQNKMHLAGASLDSIMDFAEFKRDQLKNNLPTGWKIRNGKLERLDQPKITLEDYFNKEIWAEYAQLHGITIADSANPRLSVISEAAAAIESARGLPGGGAAIHSEELIKILVASGKTMEEAHWEWTDLPVYWLMQVRDGDFGRMLAREFGRGGGHGGVVIPRTHCCSGFDATAVQMGLVACTPGC